ncbi:MAG: flagellar motor switch protein FliN [Alicyclobacillus sp. RIFOXYA1_FULL_53_8]|nr:MAG: flagellar motor switch protein FliN [Alicyclobacillus sp. RIFOXYA1_FULL_53_8]
MAAAETAASLATALPPLAPPPARMPSQPALSPAAPVVAPPPQVVQRPEFVDFSLETAPVAKEQRNLALLYDVPLTVTVELGRTKKTIRDILDLSSGAILELDKLAGEPVDILVNNKRIAIGEVVVIDENFGVRVTDILSPIERVKNLQ